MAGGIKSWPMDERPREKLIRYGEHRLSDTELLSIILRSGAKGQSAIDLARSIIRQYGAFRNMSEVDFSQWKQIKGMGHAKVSQIKAAIEIGRRFREQELEPNKTRITSSKELADILMPRMGSLKKEVLKVVFLDDRSRLIDIVEMNEGTVNQVSAVIREIFHKALQLYATALICVHNHPSGCITPSREDKKFTDDLVRSGIALQIVVLDHIIIGGNSYFSFLDKGLV